MELNLNNTELDRDKILFEEIKDLQKNLHNISKKNKRYSFVLGLLNNAINLIIIASGAVIVGITSYYNLQNVATIVLGGLIFLFSGLNMLLKLGARGFYYRKSSVRLKEIGNELKNLLYLYNNYSKEQILTFLNFYQNEINSTELDLYKKSILGEAMFGQDIRVVDPNLEALDSPMYRRKSLLNGEERSLMIELTNSKHSSHHSFIDSRENSREKSDKENSKRNPDEDSIENSSSFHNKNSPLYNKNSFHSKNILDDSNSSVVESKLYKGKENLNRTTSLPNLTYTTQKI